MKSKKVVLFDIDGVLADFVEGFTSYAQGLFPEVPVTQTANQPRWDGFPGMTHEQVESVWQEVELDRLFWYDLKPLASPDEFLALNQLTLAAQVYFTTARGGVDALHQTREWLYDQGVYKPSVILVKQKGEVARALGASYMIDDKAGNAVYAEYHNKGQAFKSYLIDRPYNQFDAQVIGSKVKRVQTVGEYLNDIWQSI